MKRQAQAAKFILALFFLALTLPTAARPITHEDVWLFRRLGAPKVSPDGKWAVFSVTEPSYEKEEQVSDLWLVPTDGSRAARRLTSTNGSEGGVHWSPQGDRIVFTAKRGKDKHRQLYILNMTGPGEAQRVSDFPLSCANPQFTPDGKKILFEAQVYPGATDAESQAKAKKEAEDKKENVSSYEGFPIRYWDHWLDGRHPRLYLLTLGSKAQPKDILTGQGMVEKPGFAGVPGLSGESLQASISPDGRSVVFAATTEKDKAARDWVTYKLYSVPINGGTVSLLPQREGSNVGPHFASDGKLYSLHEPHSDYVYNLTRLQKHNWPAADQGQILTANFDRSVGSFAVRSDGQVVVIATEHGRKRLFKVLPKGFAKALDPESRGVFSGISWAGKNLVGRYEDGITPVEVVSISGNGKSTSLSSFNKKRAAQLDWRAFREFWFTSKKGRKIHNWVVLPPNFSESKKYPLVLFIHGGPHSTSLDSGHVRWSPQLLAAGGYVVLLSDYTGSVGYGEQFSRNIQGDPLKTPGEELHQAVEEAIARYPFIDGSRVAASGASYGGHMVNWLEATSDRFKCLIGHAGLISLEGQWSTSDAIFHREINNGGLPWKGSTVWKEQSPSSYVENFKTPIMLTIGEKDYRVPLNQTLAAWTYLQRQQVPSKLLVYHQANHWIMSGPDAKHFWGEVHDWLARYLKN